MVATAVHEHRYVHEVPGVNGGYPVVRGTRTPVRSIVEIFRQLDDFDRTAAYFSHLSPEQVRDALEYYIVHPERVDEDQRLNQAAWRRLTGR
ncbi:MAG: DUF433 domain-containing protein [Chloroflexi bacterium]|nr:DUF433 domain-containing protein [Chloroflexota bacterium]